MAEYFFLLTFERCLSLYRTMVSYNILTMMSGFDTFVQFRIRKEAQRCFLKSRFLAGKKHVEKAALINCYANHSGIYRVFLRIACLVHRQGSPDGKTSAMFI